MKDKKKIAFLSLALTALLALSGCGGNNPSTDPSKNTETTSVDPGTSATESTETTTSEETTSEETTSEETTSEETTSEETTSEDPVVYHTVRFLLDGNLLKSYQVKEGETVTYDGEEPAKQPTTEVCKFVFKGWDKDVTQPITADIDFNAVFREYALEQEIDDFEKYEGDNDLADSGWKAQTLSGDTWTDETKASVTMSTNATHGEKAVRLNAWDNLSDYKIVNHGLKDKFSKAANALKFSYMAPSFMAAKVLVYTVPVEINGKLEEPKFDYTLNQSKTGDYVDYTIPLASAGWRLWGAEGKSIAETASWLGIDVDDFPTYITKIEFWCKGNKTSNTDMIAFLDNVRFVTEENPGDLEESVTILYDRYTAVLNDGTTLRIDIDAEKNAIAKVIDIETPQEVPGKITYEGENVVFTSADSGATLVYKGTMTNGGQLINFVSATGAFAPVVDKVKLNAVQVVDNYEGYASDGVAYCTNNQDPSKRSGARGAYYSEFYKENDTTYPEAPWGGNNWHLMGGNGDQLKLKQDKAGAHSGNNYLCMKNSQYNAMRYMQWGLFDGTSEKNAFRGSTFSFWAKTNGRVPAMKVRVFSQTQPTLQTQDNQRRVGEFTEAAAVGEWKHYTIELNPNLVYYGFQIFMEKNQIADSYLYIDDVEIYTADPYAAFIPEPEDLALEAGRVYAAKYNGIVNVQLTVKSDNNVKLVAPGLNMDVEGSYAIVKDEITITLTGGTVYVGTIAQDLSGIAFKSVTGNDLIAAALNNMSFGDSLVAENAEGYTESGKMYYQSSSADKRSGARGAYYCDYYTNNESTSSPVGGSKWSLMGGNGDQLSLNKNYAYEGSQSLDIKVSTNGAMRYMQWGLFDGSSKAVTGVNKFSVRVRNPLEKAATVNVMVYRIPKVEPSSQGEGYRAQTGEKTIAAKTDWTKFEVTLDPTKTYYGFCIVLKAQGGTGMLQFDYAHYESNDYNPELNFFAPKDLILSGKTADTKDASLKFGTDNKIYLTSVGAGVENVEGTYKMSMSLGQQIMEISVGGNVIKGTYAFNAATGKVTFVVTEVTGDISPLLPADTTFTS